MAIDSRQPHVDVLTTVTFQICECLNMKVEYYFIIDKVS